MLDDILDNFSNLASFTIEVALILSLVHKKNLRYYVVVLLNKPGFSIPHTSQEEVPRELNAVMPLAGGQGGLPEFGSSVNPIPTRGAHHITACPPRFENLAASLECVGKRPPYPPGSATLRHYGISLSVFFPAYIVWPFKIDEMLFA